MAKHPSKGSIEYMKLRSDWEDNLVKEIAADLDVSEDVAAGHLGEMGEREIDELFEFWLSEN